MERQSVLFAHLVSMFQFSAMQQLGKIKNPLTDKVERDLEAARVSIDMLDMLMERTKGNLPPDDEKLLTQVLRELRLNYVDEASKPESPPPEEKSTGQEAPQ